ncbi:MAG: hypothetical protein E7257_03775 [Lachnospiraceae bacterium]|nr:hypothetical protein [Lachnospiraceae bacterium]
MNPKKIIETAMLKRYWIKLIFRVVIFVGFLVIYLKDRALLGYLLNYEFHLGIIDYGITPIHALWLIFMVMMVSHLIPNKRKTMALEKSLEQSYISVEGYSREELFRFVQDQNVKAWKVMLLWLSFNAVFGILYLAEVIADVDLLMLTVFYFLSDYICILFFCPFQKFIMKNRCCVNCRIYDWGHFMMFTPMLFIKNFFSWSLFFTSLVVLIHWEILYAKYPERFWSQSNKVLQCATCKDKTCQVKRRIQGEVG